MTSESVVVHGSSHDDGTHVMLHVLLMLLMLLMLSALATLELAGHTSLADDETAR